MFEELGLVVRRWRGCLYAASVVCCGFGVFIGVGCSCVREGVIESDLWCGSDECGCVAAAAPSVGSEWGGSELMCIGAGMVGADGGSVGSVCCNLPILEVPPGAVMDASLLSVWISEAWGCSARGVEGVGCSGSNTYFGPSGLRFGVPARVTLCFGGPGVEPSRAALWCADEDGQYNIAGDELVCGGNGIAGEITFLSECFVGGVGWPGGEY